MSIVLGQTPSSVVFSTPFARGTHLQMLSPVARVSITTRLPDSSFVDGIRVLWDAVCGSKLAKNNVELGVSKRRVDCVGSRRPTLTPDSIDTGREGPADDAIVGPKRKYRLFVERNLTKLAPQADL